MYLSLVLSWQGFCVIFFTIFRVRCKRSLLDPMAGSTHQMRFYSSLLALFMRHYPRWTPLMCRIYSTEETGINGESLPVLSLECLTLTSTTDCSLRHSSTYSND